MEAIAYCVGIGPGDPELMTQKAIRLIRENDVIAVAGRCVTDAAAYRIAAAMVPDIDAKELIAINMPMTKDRSLMETAHRAGAKLIEDRLNRGRNVVYITLGDPTIYCTFSYLQHILESDGYRVELVPGITSFCAAAARLNLPLVEWDEPLHVIPAAHYSNEALDKPGTYVLMKSASRMPEIKKLLRKSGRTVSAVENCGMEHERIYRSVDEIPDDAGYFSLVIAKDCYDRKPE